MLLRLFLVLVCCGWAKSASAQSPDAVEVLFHGGQSSLYGLDLVDGVVTELGARSFAPEALASLDVKILPGGSVLLAQASGYGFAVYDDELSLTAILDPAKRYREVSRVAVANYAAFGVPSRILVGDSNASVVTIRDLQTQQVVWYRSISNGPSLGRVAGVAALPDNRVLIAVRWDDLNVSVIDVLDLSANSEPIEIASANHLAAPAEVAIVPEISDLRDVFVRDDGKFIVGTATHVLVLDRSGEVDASLPIAMAGIGGQVASIKATSTGLIVFATYTQGAWTKPDENHRIHWWNPETMEVISSGSLTAAPAAIDLWGGHGGTGTQNFLAGLDELSQGNIEDIQAQSVSASPQLLSRGDVVTVRVIVANRGEFPVPIEGLRANLGRGRCEDATQFPEDVGERGAVIIYPAGMNDWVATRVIDSRIIPGAWCVRAVVVDASGVEHELAPRVDIEVVDATHEGVPLDSAPLDFNDVSDMGSDMADAGMDPTASDGCGCSSPGQLDASVVILLGMVVPMSLLRRR